MDYIKTKEEIIKLLDLQVKASRRPHIEGVRKLSMKLARFYNLDVEKAEIAALGHDLYKNISIEEANEIILKCKIDKYYLDKLNLAHSKIAAYKLEHDFGIDDKMILAGVSYHTTGRKAMSTFEKIIFIADATEETRNYAGVEELRQYLFNDIDKACYLSLMNTKRHIEKQNLPFEDKDSLEAIEYFEDILNKRRIDMTVKEKAMMAAKLLNEKKGRDVEIIDISEKSSFADYLVIATGGSDRQVASLTEDVKDLMEEHDIEVRNVEGKHGTGWVLMDFGDVVINVFTEKMRDKYGLEEVWADCGITKVED